MRITPGQVRKKIKHYDIPDHLRELTFSCYRHLPLLRPQACCEYLAQGIETACERHHVLLFAYVFMPNHVHLLVYPQIEGFEIMTFLYAVKRPTSFRAKLYFKEHHPDFYNQHLLIQDRPGHQSFRFWQEGPGYDRNIFGRKAIDASIEYIHANPVRRGLCEYPDQWPWSSHHAYQSPGSSNANLPPHVHTDWTL